MIDEFYKFSVNVLLKKIFCFLYFNVFNEYWLFFLLLIISFKVDKSR